MRKGVEGSALVAVSTLVAIGVLELAVRVTYHAPVLSLADVRLRAIESSQTAVAIYHPVLGWTMRDGVATGGFNTAQFGVRKNSAKAIALPGDVVLAVGDSFTAGSEVVDEETWPAQLERMIDRPVINGGAGGYGLDQIVLNVERLLPIVRPKVVVVGLLVPDDVQRVGYSVYGRPKPYFVRQGARFVQKNAPVPTTTSGNGGAGIARAILARSVMMHVILSRLAPDWWFSDATGQSYARVGNNPLAVSCYLLERLHNELASRDIRSLMVLQHGGWVFARGQARSAEADGVAECAEQLGYEIVDEYESLRAIVQASADDLKQYYVMHDGGTTYGHMSRQGNANIARLIADRLRLPPPTVPAHVIAKRNEPGDGINRLSGTDAEHLSAAEAMVTGGGSDGPIPTEQAIRIAATATRSEHYAVAGWSGNQPGVYTFSVYVREQRGSGVRLQLLDSKTNGIVADYSYTDRIFDVFKVGQATHFDFASEPARNGWVRVSISAELPAAAGSVILQLRDRDGKTYFSDPSINMIVDAPMVERGGIASAYCRPGDCPSPAPTAADHR